MIARMPAAPEPDDPVLAQALTGDRRALGQLAKNWYPHMRRWALLETGRIDLAEDAVQEALIRLVRSHHTYDASLPFEPWLRTLFRNASRDAKRRKRLLSWLPFVGRHSAEAQLDLSRSAQQALAYLGDLTDRQRELIDLCDLQGHSAAEAGRRLGIEPATARVHLHEARKRLKQWMGPEVHTILKEVAR